jgi:high-affinity iron transporter
MANSPSDNAVTFARIKQQGISYATPLCIALAAIAVVSVFLWQAIAAGGNPDPTTRGLSPTAMVLSTSVLVFREGLEAILVLAAVTAGMARGKQKEYLRAVPVGALMAFLATIATWFLVMAIISEVNAPELAIQAATGLLAIVVLLVVMNWFFHKLYWTGWIAHHSNRKRRLLETANATSAKTFFGLALLGFTAIYREGFEIVLFLQNLRLRAGNSLIFQGTAIGLGLTLMVAALTFIAHKRLPYKRMLIWTGILLGVVLLVMVGESVQEMQQAGWIASTPVGIHLPAWIGLWFSVFPNVQSLAAQALAALLVIGSYFSAQYINVGRPKRRIEIEQEQTAERAARTKGDLF